MKKYGLSFSLGILFLFGCFCSLAAPAENLFTKIFHEGDSAYQKGDFSAAEQHYLRILNSGIENAAVYYNLGNACFKQKRIGDAIYYWEKARRILPNDREIRENLELANLLLVDRIEAPAGPLPVKFLSAITGFLTISQECIVLLILFLLANVLFFLYFRGANSLAYRALIGCFATALMFLLVAGSLSWKIYQNSYIKEGIVLGQKVDVRSGPGQENITVFTIHEGIKVRIHQSENGWRQISLPNGWNGWLPQNNLGIL
jgi:tetratricopeptide (TPR) repeat protein